MFKQLFSLFMEKNEGFIAKNYLLDYLTNSFLNSTPIRIRTQ
jgi:hypothetical protein